MKGYRKLWLIVIVVLMTGCSSFQSSSQSSRSINPAPYVALVQAALDGFIEANSVLPIMNSEMDTPIYEKYKVDFTRLIQQGYLQSIPENAFENGGTHYYTIVDPETNPKIKLLDLISVREARDVERRIKQYFDQHGVIPTLNPVTTGWYTIDYDKLKIDEVQVKSVYSNHYLGLLVHMSGAVVIDYGIDIMQLLMSEEQRVNEHELDETFDLRTLLVEHYHFVPAQSVAYYWKDDQPVLSPFLQ